MKQKYLITIENIEPFDRLKHLTKNRSKMNKHSSLGTNAKDQSWCKHFKANPVAKQAFTLTFCYFPDSPCEHWISSNDRIEMGVEKGDMKPSTSAVNINFKLTLSQRIWLFFILPTALNCAVYIADVATDIAVVERHLAEARLLPAILTFILIYAPAFAFLAITLSDKRRQQSESASRVKWSFKQLILAIFFPIHAMHRCVVKRWSRQKRRLQCELTIWFSSDLPESCSGA